MDGKYIRLWLCVEALGVTSLQTRFSYLIIWVHRLQSQLRNHLIIFHLHADIKVLFCFFLRIWASCVICPSVMCFLPFLNVSIWLQSLSIFPCMIRSNMLHVNHRTSVRGKKNLIFEVFQLRQRCSYFFFSPHVYFIAPPTFTQAPPPALDALVGSHLSLACVAQGNPPPTITWLKDGRVIEGTNNQVSFCACLRKYSNIIFDIPRGNMWIFGIWWEGSSGLVPSGLEFDGSMHSPPSSQPTVTGAQPPFKRKKKKNGKKVNFQLRWKRN